MLTGKTGSGKSYHSVSMIMEALETGRKVYTNIFINIDFPNYIYIDELGVRDFLSFIGDTFKDVSSLEDKKDEMRNTEYFDSDFYIDEAHLVGFREKKEAVLNWLTIHRHFNQNVFVITQIPSNVHRDYLNLFHSHIDMIPPNKRLSKSSMGFKEYDSYKGDRIKTKYFKPKTELFELYNSGNIEQAVNKNVYKLGALVVGMLFLFYFAIGSPSDFVHSFGYASNDKNHTVSKREVKQLPVNHNQTDINSSFVPSVKSFTYSLMCATDTGCYYEGHTYSLKQFLLFVLPRFPHHKKTLILSSTKSDYKLYKIELY